MSTEGCIVITVLVNKNKEIITKPDIVSRGFVYMKTNRDLIEDIKEDIFNKFPRLRIDTNSSSFFSELRMEIKTIAKDYVYQAIEKSPEIIPVIVQV